MIDPRLATRLATFGFRYQFLVGRGTTALWLAVRLLVRQFPDQLIEIVVPDLLCSSVLDGIVLAGAVPRFAAVASDRFTVTPSTIAAAITPSTRAVIIAHLYGHVVDIQTIHALSPALPIIEDAVQGLGGSQVGMMGDLSFISFDNSKMIGGRGGVLMLNDEATADAIRADLASLRPDWRAVRRVVLALLDPAAASGYELQLRMLAPTLLRPFVDSVDNRERILSDWQSLDQRVTQHNERAYWLRDQLSDQPLILPEVRANDAIWRYTFATSSALMTQQITHALVRAGIFATNLYVPLSELIGQDTASHSLRNRLINLWVDDSANEQYLQRAVRVIRSRNNPAKSR